MRGKWLALALFLALLVAALLNPYVMTPIYRDWQAITHPFPYQMMVGVPTVLSDLVSVQIPPYSGETYSLMSGLSAISEDISLVSNPPAAVLSVILQQNPTVVGQNVTFRVTIMEQPLANGQPNDENTLLAIFIVDPSGIVRGSFPSGKIQLESFQVQYYNTDGLSPAIYGPQFSAWTATTFDVVNFIPRVSGVR